MSTWHDVAAAAEVPADGTLLVDLGPNPICLYNLEGAIYATDDTCSHGHASLADGFVVDGKIECPLHQGTFDIKTGKAVDAPCRIDVKTYPVKVENGRVLIEA